MRVLFDHQAFTMQKYGGVSRCFVELYKQLSKEGDARISVAETDNAYLKEIGYNVPAGYSYGHFIMQKHFPGKARLFALKNSIKYGLPYSTCHIRYGSGIEEGKIESISALAKGGYDVFHPTYFDSYFLPYLNGKPFVLTIHDMIPELYPQYFPRNDFQIENRKLLVPKASAIIAVSENTKKDVVRLLNVPEEKVHVIYHGCSFKVQDKEIRPYDFKYLLYVGERWGYKDFDLFIKSIVPVLGRHPELRIVCTGKPFSAEEVSMFDKFGVSDKMIQHWVTSDEEMYYLYHFAECFVYTSEYEGFGIPILEAYTADCPVLLNNASCFPEIAGDAALYFTFDNLEQQCENVLSMSKEDRNIFIAKQRTRLELYSWEKSAKQLMKVYESVI